MIFLSLINSIRDRGTINRLDHRYCTSKPNRLAYFSSFSRLARLPRHAMNTRVGAMRCTTRELRRAFGCVAGH